jgi:hypothetical protein
MLASLFGIAMTGCYGTIDQMMIIHDDGKVAGSLVRPVRLSGRFACPAGSLVRPVRLSITLFLIINYINFISSSASSFTIVFLAI